MVTDDNLDAPQKITRIAAVIHLLGSTRIVKAVVVYSFGFTALLLMLAGREVPDLLHSVVLIFVGVIFEAATTQARNGNE